MPAAIIGRTAPDFRTAGLVNGSFKEVGLAEFQGRKKVVLLFYPADFSFVCPTEILAFSDAIEHFWKRNTVVLGISVDSIFVHHAWARVDRKAGGVMGVKFPLLSDPRKEISSAYGVLLEEAGTALRGLFIINEKGILKHVSIHHNDIGRNVAEVLRILDAIELSETKGVVCPANWTVGKRAIQPTQEDLEAFAAAEPVPEDPS
jgi:peroxiredoxin 2/4